MRRIGYFWTALPLGSKLQFLGLGLFLGYVFVTVDMHPARRAFGLPLWQVTGSLILCMFVLARLLLPLMMRNPERAQRILSRFGITVFLVSLISVNQRWGRLLMTHWGLTCGLWLDASCSFWLISELQRRVSLPTHPEMAATDGVNVYAVYDDKEAGK